MTDDLPDPILARPSYEAQREHTAELLRGVMAATLAKLDLALDFLEPARDDLAELNRRLDALRASSRGLMLEFERRGLLGVSR